MREHMASIVYILLYIGVYFDYASELTQTHINIRALHICECIFWKMWWKIPRWRKEREDAFYVCADRSNQYQ